MRILLLINKPQERGAEIFACDLARQLNAGANEARIAALYRARGEGPAWQSNCLLMDGDERHWSERMPGFHPGLLRRLRATVGHFNPDVIQVHGSRAVKYGSLLRRISPRRRWVLVYRNIGSPRDWLQGALRRVAYRRLIMSQMDGIVAVSEATLKEITDLYRPRVPVVHIPRGIDLSRIEAGEPAAQVRERIGTSKTARVLLSVGHLAPEKRLDRFIEVVRGVWHEGLEVEGWVVGDGPERSRLAALVEATSDLPPIRFFGARSQVGSFMAAADLLLLTSDTEGLPGVLLEAGALGVPVVATRVGGVGECVADGITGLLTSPVDVDGLVNSVVRLLADRALSRRLGSQARERMRERYSIDRIAGSYLEYYQKLLGREALCAQASRQPA